MTNSIMIRQPISVDNLCRILDSLLKDQSVSEYCEESGVDYQIICNNILNNRKLQQHVVKNLNSLKKININRLVKSVIGDLKNNLKSLMPPLPDDYCEHCDETPRYLFKYMSWEHSVDNLTNKQFSCGTLDEYRKGDQNEINTEKISKVNPDSETKLFSNILINNLVPEIGDFDSLIIKLHDVLNRQFLIGCLSDKGDDEDLWKVRAGGYGICIKVKPKKNDKFYRILYQDYIADFDHLRRQFRKLTETMMRGTVPKINKKLETIIKTWLTLSFLTVFRKDT